MHTRHFSGSSGGTRHSTTDTGGKALRLLWRLTSSGHDPRSSNLGLDSEFSYIALYCPMIRQGLIHIEEIGPPALETSHHIDSRDIVAPLPHSARDPTQRQLGRSESNVDYFDQIAPTLPILETLRVVQATQRTLKGELGPRFDQAVKFSEDHATGRYGCELRAQRRYPTGNQIEAFFTISPSLMISLMPSPWPPRTPRSRRGFATHATRSAVAPGAITPRRPS
jgi:hypothetical protein